MPHGQSSSWRYSLVLGVSDRCPRIHCHPAVRVGSRNGDNLGNRLGNRHYQQDLDQT